MNSTNLPVLVYGTLRNAGSNYGLVLENRTTEEKTVLLSGMRMYAGPRGAYPYVVRGDDADNAIVGELMYIHNDCYEDTLHSLDYLEGYIGPSASNNLYNREVVEFELDGEIIQAYIYTAGNMAQERFCLETRRIHRGDWNEFEKERLLGRSGSSVLTATAANIVYSRQNLAIKLESFYDSLR